MPLRVLRGDEELYRNAEKLVKKKLDLYSQKYNQHSIEQILTYVMYDIAVIVYKQDIRDDEVPIAEKIQELDYELEQLFSEE